MKCYSVLLFLIAAVSLTQAQDFIRQSFPNNDITTFRIADFSGNGFDDVLGLDARFGFDPSLYLYRNLETDPPSFEEMIIFKDAEMSIADVAIGDMDGDGEKDLVLVVDGDFILYRNTADSVLFEPVSLNVGGAEEIRLSDLDADGDLDIVGIDRTNSVLYVYRNEGALNFTRRTVSNVGSSIRTFDVGDVDHDGDMDILIGQSIFFGDQIILMKQNSIFSYQRLVIVKDDFVRLDQVKIADVDADNQPDLCGVAESAVDCWMNEGSLNFSRQNLVESTLSSPDGFRSFDFSDYNGDAKLDIVIGNNSSTSDGGIRWYKQLTADPLTYEEREVGGVRTAAYYAHTDLDGDGDVDMLTTNGDVWMYLNEIVQEPVAIHERGQLELLSYPNPVTETLYFNNLPTGDYQFQLIDSSGKNVIKGEIVNAQLSMKKFPIGIYLVKIWDEYKGISYQQQIVKK